MVHARALRRAAPLRAGGIVVALLAALATSPVVARTVEYLHDIAAIQAAAKDQGITGPFSEEPSADGTSIILETPAAADHRVVIASNYCQAYNIDNPVSVLLQSLVAAANRAQTADAISADRPSLSLRILSSSTLLRCMGKSDLEMICKTRVRISAEANFVGEDGAAGRIPVVSQIEREGRVGGFCGNIARFTGIVTREAGIDLISHARKAAGA